LLTQKREEKERGTEGKTPLPASVAHIRCQNGFLAGSWHHNDKVKLAPVTADEFGVFAGDASLFGLAQKAAPTAVVIVFRAAIGEDHRDQPFIDPPLGAADPGMMS